MTDPKLPADVRVETFHVADHHLTERILDMTTPNPETVLGGATIDVTIDGTIDSRNAGMQMPMIILGQHRLTRKQWEQVKRLGDLAWAEFERRVSDKETP
jgi:hypothetical protein